MSVVLKSCGIGIFFAATWALIDYFLLYAVGWKTEAQFYVAVAAAAAGGAHIAFST